MLLLYEEYQGDLTDDPGERNFVVIYHAFDLG